MNTLHKPHADFAAAFARRNRVGAWHVALIGANLSHDLSHDLCHERPKTRRPRSSSRVPPPRLPRLRCISRPPGLEGLPFLSPLFLPASYILPIRYCVLILSLDLSLFFSFSYISFLILLSLPLLRPAPLYPDPLPYPSFSIPHSRFPLPIPPSAPPFLFPLPYSSFPIPYPSPFVSPLLPFHLHSSSAF